ncbi:MAG: hypothetical protein H6569_08765 [Lewinellaceae bacterium]|nr:hypothetical protein [Saprospiraceae bacterium]MCB9316215.1 hypothetical protein [Lewinellaceae bacterium]
MDDPQEFKSLDALFRKTFENLPDSPAASGWDSPSPRVWEQVRTQIKPPARGWTGKSILLISGLAVVLMLGLYWALTQTDSGAQLQAPTEQPTMPVATPDASDAASAEDLVANETTAIPAATPAQNRLSQKQQKQTNTKKDSQYSNNTQEEAAEGVQRRLPGSAPLPGTNPASPNTTVRRQMEAWRGAPWAQPLAPLPNILESQFIRPVPESLKNLGN